MNRSTTWLRRLERALIVFFLIASTGAVAVAQTGTLGVTVIEPGGKPVFQAQVSVVNSNLGGLTGLDGKLLLRGVSVGPHQVRVLRVGYAEQKKDVTVTNQGSVAVEFTLSQVAISLTPVVTTATGETRRVELGNSVSTIDAGKLTESSPIANMNDLLNARAPGVLVTPGMQTGTGARVRIRGTSSLSLGNDPIYIIDGIRMSSGNGTSLFTGDNNPTRVGDINPEEIENIEIVKGPSAATLYGTDAANGVIVITTKKGRAGAAQWNVFGESGQLQDRNPYPLNYTIAGHTPGLTAYRECALPLISAGTCVKDSVRIYSPLHDPGATPIGNGYRAEAGVGVRGGSDQVRYNVQASREQETGIFKLPDFEYVMLDSMKQPLRPWVTRPNALDRTAVRANLSFAPNQTLDISVSSGFTTIDQRLLQSSNATAGIGSQGFGGPGYSTNGFVAVTGTPLHGYRAWTPAYTYQEKVEQGINRFIGSVNVNWRPTSWLQNRLDAGNDLTDRLEDNLLFRGEGPPISATYRNGFVTSGRADIRTITANLSSTATWNPRPWLNSKTTVGIQYTDFKQYQNSASGTDLPPGTQTANAGATPGASQSTTLTRTLGQFIEQVVAINDRFFVTGALRSDQNSAFGTDFQSVIYPKLSASWVISEEPWFKGPKQMDNLRLRFSFGKSGVQPGPNDALRTFAASSPNIRGVDVPAEQFSTIGNPELKPEQSSEIETGFEARFFRGRASIDYTYYYKQNKDALISAIVPPSLGASSSVRQNLGAVRNLGQEILINGQVIDKPWLGFDLTITGSINQNQVLSLGGTPPQIGTTIRTLQGYPLFGLWARAITGWNDKNKDGILTYNADPTLNEVFVDTAFSFRGYSAPREFLALTTGFDLLKRKLRITALTDWRGGNRYYNNTERIRCVSRQNCNGRMNPASSFEEQAMVVGTLNDPSATLDGFFQVGEFIKLREVSAQYTLPQTLAASLRARSASLTFSVRNVAKWTRYRGVDPEADFTATGGGDAPSDFQSFGAPTYYILRLNLGF
jgi:TonB-linked SusC/RagA family outer membrane protein